MPFARTKAERLAAGDPRSSLEERYGAQEGYQCVVERAAKKAVAERFLLRPDADRLIAEAAGSKILPSSAEASAENRATARTLCSAGL